jgi:hypothetical protein
MQTWTYDQSDEMHDRLSTVKRGDLERYVPLGGSTLAEAAAEFWGLVAAQFSRGDYLDAVTEIERRFEQRGTQKGDREALARARVPA